MSLQFSPLHFVFLLFLAAVASHPISKPGCPDRCGNLSIPFPFGVGSDCSLEPSFSINCNLTAYPTAYIETSDKYRKLQVVEISATQVRVSRGAMLNIVCYNDSGYQKNSSKPISISLVGTQYTLSEENWFTAVGCDDMVLGIGLGNRTFGGGCASFCPSPSDQGGFGFCPSNVGNGNGCCRTSIPGGLSHLGAKFIDISKEWRANKLFQCSYAFIQEKVISNFSYPLPYLNNMKSFLNYTRSSANRMPVFRLDWRIGAEVCSDAQRNNMSYVCKDNSECVDVDFQGEIQGYHCRCMHGYEGNPYLSPGCRDIDECVAKPCHPNSFCINTPGSFNCSCRKGYYGDARLNGTGCIQLPSSKNINLAVGLGSGIGVPLLLSMWFILHKEFQKKSEKMRKERYYKQNGGLILQQKTNEGTIRKTKHFCAKELEKATDHFNENRILGQGGQGTVYKGMLCDGKIVAVKKSVQVDEEHLEQFINEIVILSQVDHKNVVKLLGCCLESEVPLLVYEFVPNGTLFNLIHDSDTQFQLSWDMRLQIATDIAGALAYLHSSCSLHICHRDIKSSNILLDEKYIVKVADFGISRSVAQDRTHFTTNVKGTFGYFDPEYFQSHQYNEKSDVYSFGVVLAEILTGNMPIFYERSEEMQKSLAWHFLESIEENKLDSILDPKVSKEGRREEVIVVARIAQNCLNLKRGVRPTMKEVATKFESLRISRQPATFELKLEEANSVVISNIQSAFTTTCVSEASTTFSDIQPLMFEAAEV